MCYMIGISELVVITTINKKWVVLEKKLRRR
jgi:hypothetical protein